MKILNLEKVKQAKILVLILQAIGCKVDFTSDEIKYSHPHLVTGVMRGQIHEHKEEIQQILDSDFRLMSIDGNVSKGAVGTQLKKMITQYYPDISYDYMQTRFDELDARGYQWCHVHKHKIIIMMQQLADKNNIKFTYRQMLTIVKKAIADAKKSFIS
tara:strand:+ start:1499 stop:1972 length:474 start_codon:yes stop_codon:yes gene_type:complete